VAVVREPLALWPATALFAVACIVACVAAAVDASVATTKHEAELDADERYEAIRKDAEEASARVKAINLEALAQLQKDVEYLKAQRALEGL
jgi:hypothetical protein